MEDDPSDHWGPIEIFLRFWIAGIGCTVIALAAGLLRDDVEMSFREVATDFGIGVALSLLSAAGYTALHELFIKKRTPPEP